MTRLCLVNTTRLWVVNMGRRLTPTFDSQVEALWERARNIPVYPAYLPLIRRN